MGTFLRHSVVVRLPAGHDVVGPSALLPMGWEDSLENRGYCTTVLITTKLQVISVHSRCEGSVDLDLDIRCIDTVYGEGISSEPIFFQIIFCNFSRHVPRPLRLLTAMISSSNCYSIRRC